MSEERRIVEQEITKDLHLAATLVTLGHTCIGIDLQREGNENRQIGYFRFEKTAQLIEDERMYAAGKILVEPRLFAANIKSLKSSVSSSIKAPR